MNKRLLFRILGTLSSAMIIVGVFVPFVSFSGFSQSLWESYKTLDSTYLPIMIIAFGSIALISFLINKKTEFAYMTTGAILFFVIMNTVDVVEQDMLKSLSIGYYLLAGGSVLTGVMAFLVSLKSQLKEKAKAVQGKEVTQASVLDQIDKLYSTPEPLKQPMVQTVDSNDIQQLQSPQQQPLGEVEPVVPIPSLEAIPEIVPLPGVEPVPEKVEVNPVLAEFVQPDQNASAIQSNLNQPIQQPSMVVEQPVQQPIQQSSIVVEQPVQQPIQQPSMVVEQPVQQPIQQSSIVVEQPIQQPSIVVEQPVQQPLSAVNSNVENTHPVDNPV